MKTSDHRTAPLGDLVVAAFDAAARLSAEPREVSRLATLIVKRLLYRRHRVGRILAERSTIPA